jgi:hypothetical protein
VNHHRRDQPCIMGILTKNRCRSDELLPDAVYQRRLVEPMEQGFGADQLHNGFGRSFALPVDVRRPRADDPELIEVLRDDVKPVALTNEKFSGIKRRLVHRMPGLCKPGQDVGIHQVVHSPRPM